MKKKLIEVSLPLEAINIESAREKSIRHGHPSTLHLWWARRPLAACRAVLFASLVDDPSSHTDNEEEQKKERNRLFKIIEDLVKWENINNKDVLDKAKAEILKSTDGNPPPVLDPFCGGGSIPLEAQRLGLKAYGSDLNPVAVLITKALIEIPPKFAGKPPVNPTDAKKKMPGEAWTGATGLAADVRYYGQWMRDEAEEKIGHLYPKVKLPKSQGGGEATVIAWIWARTVKCPNPGCGAEMPLARSFWLSKKTGKEAWIEVKPNPATKKAEYIVRSGKLEGPDGTVERSGGTCIFCEEPVPFPHIRTEGKLGRMSQQLIAIVAEGTRGRLYVSPDPNHVLIAASASPEWYPETELTGKATVNVGLYGFRVHGDLFTPRQLVALTTFSDLVGEARKKVLADAKASGMSDDGVGIEDGGTGATAYADAVATYLAFAVDKMADRHCALASWDVTRDNVRNAFGRQALPMVWDYADSNPFSSSTGNWLACVDWVWKVVAKTPATGFGIVRQLDARVAADGHSRMAFATDPPYYDNIGYADLSDFFFVWLRKALKDVHPQLFSTLMTPKAEELIATPYRHDGNKHKAEEYFQSGLRDVFTSLNASQVDDIPLTVYYAFKQAETSVVGETVSTGWETMLDGLIDSRFSITATLPIRSELSNRQIASGTNALASSVVMACRKRPADAPMTTRRDFLSELHAELPSAVKHLQQGNIAPVDLAQAAIGPGMAVFSKYSKVLESDGTPMTVRTALGLINQVLDEALAEQESEFDADTRWALAWFETYGMDEGPYDAANTLSMAKVTSVHGLVDAGFLHSKAGKVRLLKRTELDPNWDPLKDNRLTVWEVTQHLIRALEEHGESGAAEIARKVGAEGETARDLAYRLYTLCERKKWAQDALAYNSLVTAWPQIKKQAGQTVSVDQQQRIEGT